MDNQQQSYFEQLPMHSYTFRMSEHWLQLVFIFLSFLSRDKIIRLVLFSMETTENLECARNEKCTVGAVVGNTMAHAMLHTREGSSWGTAFSCDLLWTSECFYSGMLQVLYSCAQIPNKLHLLGFKRFVILFLLSNGGLCI